MLFMSCTGADNASKLACFALQTPKSPTSSKVSAPADDRISKSPIPGEHTDSDPGESRMLRAVKLDTAYAGLIALPTGVSIGASGRFTSAGIAVLSDGAVPSRDLLSELQNQANSLGALAGCHAARDVVASPDLSIPTEAERHYPGQLGVGLQCSAYGIHFGILLGDDRVRVPKSWAPYFGLDAATTGPNVVLRLSRLTADILSTLSVDKLTIVVEMLAKIPITFGVARRTQDNVLDFANAVPREKSAACLLMALMHGDAELSARMRSVAALHVICQLDEISVAYLDDGPIRRLREGEYCELSEADLQRHVVIPYFQILMDTVGRNYGGQEGKAICLGVDFVSLLLEKQDASETHKYFGEIACALQLKTPEEEGALYGILLCGAMQYVQGIEALDEAAARRVKVLVRAAISALGFVPVAGPVFAVVHDIVDDLFDRWDRKNPHERRKAVLRLMADVELNVLKYGRAERGAIVVASNRIYANSEKLVFVAWMRLF